VKCERNLIAVDTES